MSLNDDAFIASIHDKDLQAKYRKTLKAEISKTRKQFQSQRKKFKQDQIDGISDNEAHDEIINMSLHPFVEKTPFTEKLGYELRYCDPLYEKNVQNFDFLIAKKTEKKIIAIFGEGKTTKNKAQSIVNEVINKQKVVEENKEYILKTYLNDTTLSVDFEYVISVYSRFVDEVQDALEQTFKKERKDKSSTTNNASGKKTKIIIWKVDEHESLLDLANPGHNDDRLRMLHSDNALNSLLKDCEVTRKFFSFFPQSHSATKIKSLITMLESVKASTGKIEFTATDVDAFFQTELYYLDIERRKEIRKEVLKRAAEIGFIDDLGFDKYTVKSEFSGSSLKDDTVERLWVNFRIREEQTKRIDACRERVQSEIRDEYEEKPRMEKYFT